MTSTNHPAPDRQVVDTGALFQHLDRLTLPSTEAVRRYLPGHRERVVTVVQVPSLWEQMEDRVASDNAGGGRGKAGPGSRAPIDVGMASLMDEISRKVVRALLVSGLPTRWRPVHPELLPTTTSGPTQPVIVQARHPAPDPQPGREPSLGLPYIDPDLAAHLLERMQRRVTDTVARAAARELDTPANLRALSAHLGDGYTPQDVVTEWEHTYRRWVAQAETALALENDENTTVRLPVKGVPCAHCLATAVVRYDEDGGTHWDPPMVAVIRDEELLFTVCQLCGGRR